MEAYPEDYVAHNLPYIVLSGLAPTDSSTRPSSSSSRVPGQGSGLSISDKLPPLSGPVADSLVDELLRASGASLAWSDGALAERSGLIGFKVTSTEGRVGMPPTTHSLSVSQC